MYHYGVPTCVILDIVMKKYLPQTTGILLTMAFDGMF